MNEFLSYVKNRYTFAISETGIELRKYLKDLPCFQEIPSQQTNKLIIVTVLLYMNHEFEITFSNSYNISDHKLFGSSVSYPCKTMFIHSSIDDFENNILKIKEAINSALT